MSLGGPAGCSKGIWPVYGFTASAVESALPCGSRRSLRAPNRRGTLTAAIASKSLRCPVASQSERARVSHYGPDRSGRIRPTSVPRGDKVSLPMIPFPAIQTMADMTAPQFDRPWPARGKTSVSAGDFRGTVRVLGGAPRRSGGHAKRWDVPRSEHPDFEVRTVRASVERLQAEVNAGMEAPPFLLVECSRVKGIIRDRRTERAS